jgi:hypothetical protein
MSALANARAKLREQLDWRTPRGLPHDGPWALTRPEVQALLAGPTEPVAVLDEIGRLALLVKKDEVEAYADAGGMKPRHRRFTCKGCGTDWMTVLPDADTCQACYHRGQPDIADWIRTDAPEPLPSDSFICTGGKRVHVGKPCPHCGAKTRGSECKLRG